MTGAADRDRSGAGGAWGAALAASLARLWQRRAKDRSPPPGAPEPALFREIPVMPPKAVYLDRALADGGPVWPDFESQTWVRFLRRDVARDRPPAISDGVPERIRRPAVWGGHLTPHFGHLAAEFLTRLPWSLALRPHDLYLFGTYPELGDGTTMPAHFWDLLAWYGLPRAQVRFVTRPLRVATLRVLPQAEQMNFVAPAPAYLDLIEAIAARNRLPPSPAEVLFVGRPGLIRHGLGVHPGEGYLAGLLGRLGVTLLDPAVAPLRAQLAAYAGARTIVFAEGSALHGRQILGRIDQRIVVLVRRPKERLVSGALAPRSRELAYVEATRRTLAAVRTDGALLEQKALSFYDLPAVFAAFRGLGLALEPHWDDAAFRAEMRRDVVDWLDVLAADPARYRRDETEANIAAAFDAEAIDLPSRPDWGNPRRLDAAGGPA